MTNVLPRFYETQSEDESAYDAGEGMQARPTVMYTSINCGFVVLESRVLVSRRLEARVFKVSVLDARVKLGLVLGLEHPSQYLTTQFLQVGCPSCRPTNSVKALKTINMHLPNAYVHNIIQ